MCCLKMTIKKKKMGYRGNKNLCCHKMKMKTKIIRKHRLINRKMFRQKKSLNKSIMIFRHIKKRMKKMQRQTRKSRIGINITSLYYQTLKQSKPQRLLYRKTQILKNQTKQNHKSKLNNNQISLSRNLISRKNNNKKQLINILKRSQKFKLINHQSLLTSSLVLPQRLMINRRMLKTFLPINQDL